MSLPLKPRSLAFSIADFLTLEEYKLPIVKLLSPKTTLEPPSSHSSTSLESPGSNLTEVPAGIFR